MPPSPLRRLGSGRETGKDGLKANRKGWKKKESAPLKERC